MLQEQSGPGPTQDKSEANGGSHTRKDVFILHDQLTVGTLQVLINTLPEFLWNNSPCHLPPPECSAIFWLCPSYPATFYHTCHTHTCPHSSFSSILLHIPLPPPLQIPPLFTTQLSGQHSVDLPSLALCTKAPPHVHTAPLCPHIHMYPVPPKPYPWADTGRADPLLHKPVPQPPSTGPSISQCPWSHHCGHQLLPE